MSEVQKLKVRAMVVLIILEAVRKHDNLTHAERRAIDKIKGWVLEGYGDSALNDDTDYDNIPF